MTPQDTMRLALEALENCIGDSLLGGAQRKAAIEALRSALAQPPKFTNDLVEFVADALTVDKDHARALMSQALAQQGEQQPVVTKTEKGCVLHVGWDELPAGTKLYAGAAPLSHPKTETTPAPEVKAITLQSAQPIMETYIKEDKTQPLEYWNAVEGWVTIKPDARTLQKLRQEAYKRTDMIYRDDPDTMFALGFDAGFAAHGIGVQK